MRIVVATDSLGALTSAEAGRVIAGGWPDAARTVVPIGEAGRGFSQAMADQWASVVSMLPRVTGADRDREPRIATAVVAAEGLVLTLEPGGRNPAGLDLEGSSAAAGAGLGTLLRSTSAARTPVLVDLTWSGTHDGGAGFLAALGATADGDLTAGAAGLAEVSEVDLTPVRALLATRPVIGIVPDDQLTRPLCGLRGITSLRGRAAGEDPARLLATDSALQRFADLVAPGVATAPGSGACGGLGLAVLALGGSLVSGPAYCADSAGLDQALTGAHLALTGTSVFDFASRGGGVVTEVARRAASALLPCIAIAGEVLIGGRELRTLGIESAYAVRTSSTDAPSGDVSEAELAGVAARVARSWRW